MRLPCAEQRVLSSVSGAAAERRFFGPNLARTRYSHRCMCAGFPPSVTRAARCGACLALAALAWLSAGCGPSTDPAAGDRVVLRYWDKWTGFEEEAMRRVVDDFNASQNRIFVDYSSVSGVDRKFMLATAGGVPPDVVGLFSVQVPVYAENNAFTPLDQLAAEAGVRRENYIDVFWKICTHRGHLWALPTTPGSSALVWNKKLFREAGLDPERPPHSLAELEEFNAKLTRYRPDGRLDRMGFVPEDPSEIGTLWQCWFGGAVWDGQGKMTLDSPATVAAYRWVQSYPERFGADNLLAFQAGFGNFASPQAPFFSSKVAMELEGVWSYNFIKAYAPADFEWGVAPFPAADPAHLADVTVVDTDVLAIPRGVKHLRESFEFLRYVNSQGPMEKLCLGQLKFTPLRECSPGFLANHPNPYVGQYLALAKSPNARHEPQLTNWTECANDLRVALDVVWDGKEDAVTALAGAQRRTQHSLDQQNARWNRLSTQLLSQWGRQP